MDHDNQAAFRGISEFLQRLPRVLPYHSSNWNWNYLSLRLLWNFWRQLSIPFPPFFSQYRSWLPCHRFDPLPIYPSLISPQISWRFQFSGEREREKRKKEKPFLTQSRLSEDLFHIRKMWDLLSLLVLAFQEVILHLADLADLEEFPQHLVRTPSLLDQFGLQHLFSSAATGFHSDKLRISDLLVLEYLLACLHFWKSRGIGHFSIWTRGFFQTLCQLVVLLHVTAWVYLSWLAERSYQGCCPHL